MCIVLSEAADAEQTVESAGELMTVDKTQLTNAQGYVMIPEETEGLDKGTLVDVVLF